MLLKRILVILISMAVGAAVTVGIVAVVLETSVAEYGAFYFLMTALFLGLAVGIWLDKFLGTNFLPE